MNLIKLSWLVGITCSFSLSSVDYSSLNIPSLDQVTSGLQSVGSSASNILGGFAEGFGYCPTNRNYSMQVWNDTPTPSYSLIQNITGFLGASLAGTPIAATLLNPLTNSGDDLLSLPGVCAGKVYMAPSTADSTGVQTFEGLTYAAKSGSLNLGGVGGTSLYVATDILDIFTTVFGSLTGEVEILDAMLQSYSYYQRPFDTVADDTSTYFYRSFYTQGENKGEFLNADLATSTEFSGIFYNGSKNNVTLSFIKNNSNYSVTLESQTFNILSSTTGVQNSIRPDSSDDTKAYADRRSFSFTIDDGTIITIPVGSIGLADNIYDSQGQISSTLPRTYTYEVYDGSSGQEVGIQGLQIGNYDQPGVEFDESRTAIIAAMPSDITQRPSVITGMASSTSFYSYPLLKNLRDINPVTASLWYQSAETALQDAIEADPSFNYSAIPYNLPQTLWVYYAEKDSGKILKSINPGEVLDLEFFRPTVSENLSYLYAFALDTTDATKAQQFFDNLFVTARPAQYYTSITDPLNIPEISSITPDINGYVKDEVSGVSGWYLLNDIFTRTGIGPGPYYYAIAPSYLILGQLASVVGAYLDTSTYTDTTSLNKSLMEPITSWLTYFVQNKAMIDALNIVDATSSTITQAIPELTSYIQTNGTQSAKDNLKSTLYALIYGPISMSNPPIYMQGGTNYFTTPATDWPGESVA